MINVNNMKISSYQKLKNENLLLKQDLYVLVMSEEKTAKDILKVLGVKIKWQMKFKLENK